MRPGVSKFEGGTDVSGYHNNRRVVPPADQITRCHLTGDLRQQHPMGSGGIGVKCYTGTESYTRDSSILIFTHLKLCLATAIHNFKWMENIQISTISIKTNDNLSNLLLKTPFRKLLFNGMSL